MAVAPARPTASKSWSSELMRCLVLNNQVMVGSVSAARDHFQIAVDDLSLACARWGDHVAGLITNRHPARDFGAVLHQHLAEEIKVVLEWG
jgi:glucose 1-dehydrogenase